MKRLALSAACLALTACASVPLIVEGRFLQSGPADAPLVEIALETRGTCEMLLREFSYSAGKVSRCAATSAKLGYSYDATVPIFGLLPVTARSLSACNEFRERGLKTNAAKKGEMSVTECRTL